MRGIAVKHDATLCSPFPGNLYSVYTSHVQGEEAGHQETVSLSDSGLDYRTKRRPTGTSHKPIVHACDAMSPAQRILVAAARGG
jgi:hypothetical protein